MSTRLLALMSTCLAGIAAANPYAQPWSQVESGDNSQVRKESRLAVVKVDGVSTRQTASRRGDAIAPGKHVVTIRYESARGPTSDSTRDLELDMEPCVRYRIVARYQSVSGSWDPKVYSEPISECVAKFKTPKGKGT